MNCVNSFWVFPYGPVTEEARVIKGQVKQNDVFMGPMGLQHMLLNDQCEGKWLHTSCSLYLMNERCALRARLINKNTVILKSLHHRACDDAHVPHCNQCGLFQHLGASLQV